MVGFAGMPKLGSEQALSTRYSNYALYLYNQTKPAETILLTEMNVERCYNGLYASLAQE